MHADATKLAAAADGQRHEPTWEHDDGCHTPAPPADLDLDPLGDPPLGRIENGPCVPDPVLRRLACDTTLVGMASDADGQPIGVGRKTRTVPGWLRRLLYARDPGCMYPGCPNTVWTDAHHIWHWLDGGLTILALLIRLCRGHHTHVHAANIGIAQSIHDRSWTFHHPDGAQITPVPALPGASGDPLPSGDGINLWEGDPARLDPIMDALVHADTDFTTHHTQPDVSAGTSTAARGGP